MKRPALVALVALAALAITVAWGAQQRGNLVRMQNLLNDEYQRSFYSTLTHVQNLEVLLGKALVGRGGSEEADLLAETCQEAALAQEGLTQLPTGQPIVARTSMFLNQTGDFTNALLRQVATGRQLSEAQWETLLDLHQQAGTLNTGLRNIERIVEEGGARLWELGPVLRVRRGALGTAPAPLMDNQLAQLDREVERFPTLVYDGAFSEHLDRRKPRAASGAPVTGEEARERALAAVDRDSDQLASRLIETTKGRIPSFRVEIADRRDRSGSRILVDVARRGGQVVWMLDTAGPGGSSITISEARRKAEEYLKRQRKLVDVATVASEMQSEGAVTFDLAPRQDGVILYTDLIKVTVDLEEGRVTGLNALNWMMNHQSRELPAPVLSAAEAARGLHPRFKIADNRLALIPIAGGREVLAWQIRGETAGNTYLVFVNAENGNREQIFQVVETPEGILTI